MRFGEMMMNQGTMEKQNNSVRPAAPPIYRSQPAPQPKLTPPPVYRPQPLASQAKLAAPPVYRPQPTAPQAKLTPPPVYRPQPPAPQAKLVAPPVYRPHGARPGLAPVKGAGTKKGCCLACARPGTAPHPFGNRAVSHSIQQSKVARSSAPAPAKEEKKKWNGPSDKKAKKQAATKRHVVVVVADKAKEVESCESSVNFSAQFNTHILNGELAGTSHSGYHSESATNFAAFGAGNVTGAADANGVYTADCTMNPGPGRVAKSSTFFPAAWDIATIRTEAAHAYCHQIAKGGIAGAGALAWVGNSTGGMMIGGTSGLPLNTAFPAYNGGFV